MLHGEGMVEIAVRLGQKMNVIITTRNYLDGTVNVRLVMPGATVRLALVAV